MDGEGIVVARSHGLVGSQDRVLSRVSSETAKAIESALIAGDLKALTTENRIAFYNAICDSVGLNPLTRPLEYIVLNGKLTLYARKDATDQLRKLYDVAVEIIKREQVGSAYVVTARACTPEGRQDESIGAVDINGLKGQDYANALMKAETKAKRRVTLSICGLGYLDETEIEETTRPKYRYLTPETDAIDADVLLDAEDIRDIETAAVDAEVATQDILDALAKRGISSLAAIKKADKPKLLEWIQKRGRQGAA